MNFNFDLNISTLLNGVIILLVGWLIRKMDGHKTSHIETAANISSVKEWQEHHDKEDNDRFQDIRSRLNTIDGKL